MTNSCNPGDVVAIDFPGVSGIKRRPIVVLSSPVYHALRPEMVVGLITIRRTDLGPTDYTFQDPQPFIVGMHSGKLELPDGVPKLELGNQ